MHADFVLWVVEIQRPDKLWVPCGGGNASRDEKLTRALARAQRRQYPGVKFRVEPYAMIPRNER